MTDKKLNLLISFFLVGIGLNSLFQAYLVGDIKRITRSSLSLAKEGEELARYGMEGIRVLKKINELTKEAYELSRKAEGFQAQISEPEIKTLLQEGREADRLLAKILESKSEDSFTLLIQGIYIGKHDLALSKKSLRNARTLLSATRWANKQWPALISMTEESVKINEQYVDVVEKSRALSEKLFSNTKAANTKLQKYIKFFRSRVKK